METLRTLFIHCLAIVLSFASIIPALAAEETLYYDQTPMDAFFLSTSARTGETKFNLIDDNFGAIPFTGNIASGTAVASGTTITGEIRLAAYDSDSLGIANFTLTLKKNDTSIGDTTIAVDETAPPLTYTTYLFSFATTDNFTAADTLIWNIATSDAVLGTEDRGMQLDPDHSFLVFPKVYSVIYEGNGNTGGSVPVDSNSYSQGEEVTVSGNIETLFKAGSEFSGWNTTADGGGSSYVAGALFFMGSLNVTLYAQWNDSDEFPWTMFLPAILGRSLAAQ